jgi:hypothetical protein
VPVTSTVAVPIGFGGIEPVRAVVHAAAVRYVIEDVKFELRSPTAFRADSGVSKVCFGAFGYIARIVGEIRMGIGFQRGADEAQGRHFPERVEKACIQLWHQDHISGFDTFQSYCRAVKTDPFLHERRRKLRCRYGQVVPASP